MFVYLDYPSGYHHAGRPPVRPDTVLDEAVSRLGSAAPATATQVRDCLSEPVSINQLEAAALEHLHAGESRAAVVLVNLLNELARRRVLHYASAGDVENASIRLSPVSSTDALDRAGFDPDGIYRLSRFAELHTGTDANIVLESPLSPFRCDLARGRQSASAMRAVAMLAEGTSLTGLTQARLPRAQRDCFLMLLAAARIIDRVDDEGRLPEEVDPVLRQWERHDLAFHMRSRMGFHDQRMGGDFRFKGELPPTPALHEEPPHLARVPLAVPDLVALATNDPRLTATMEARKSKRPAVSRAMTLDELGVFLYRAARVKGYVENDLGGTTQRPFPSGGASYEFEIYVTAARITGLSPGFYFYNALTHELLLLRYYDDSCDQLRTQASQSMAFTTRPDLVLTLGSRFQRVAWKYAGMAYATQLKDAGAAYTAFYLIATAMGLSPCALGLGSIATFQRLTGQHPLVEGSIGEFALSGPEIKSST